MSETRLSVLSGSQQQLLEPQRDLTFGVLARFFEPLFRSKKVNFGEITGSVLRPYLGKITSFVELRDGTVDVVIRLFGSDESPLLQDGQFDLAQDGLLITSGRMTGHRRSFRYRVDLSYRLLSGVLLSNSGYYGRRFTTLRDLDFRPVPQEAVISIQSDCDISGLKFGIYENSGRLGLSSYFEHPSTKSDHTVGYPKSVLSSPGQELLGSTTDSPRAATACLAERLLKIEERLFNLMTERGIIERENQQLRDSTSKPTGKYFDVPLIKYDWLLASDSKRSLASLDKYDRRVDDLIIISSQAGDQFFCRYGLLSATPDWENALSDLRHQAKILNIVPETSLETPDVSIVIPVYGQLSYTLNCLHGLFNHLSKYSAEIIVIDDCSLDCSGTFLPRLSEIRYHRQSANGGFISSCNFGGQMARGRYIIMLNNDTRVADGWLYAPLDSFTYFPKAGLVGSKLCYSDGTLQEAGGIIWRDGSCWNYGRNDDPNRPQYSYAREVDYISGCSIVLPVETWRALKGFDDYYAPAYCEDADLCLRVKAAGFEVWMQPQSRVVHYEGKTSGTDTAHGAKSYQILNTKKLFLRWREHLTMHRLNGEASFFERERKVTKRILVVDATAPTPDQDAGSVQTIVALHAARKLGYKVHFVPEDNWLYQPDYTGPLQAFGVDCAYAPFDVGFVNYVRQFGWMFDVVLVYRVHTLARIYDEIREFCPQAILLFHLADLHFLRRQRQAILDSDPAGLHDAEEIKEMELGLVKGSDCTITHSRVEAEILDAEAPGSPVIVWPLMFEFFGTSVPFEKRQDICFLGGYRHNPNVDAVIFFVREVLPFLLLEEPELRFIIAGYSPTQDVLALAGPNVHVAGPVEDLRDLFDAARVFVCPLRIGAGVKGKIISALAYGIPVVSTSVGVEGADLVNDEQVIVADDPNDFAQATLRVYRDATLWHRLSAQGQTFIREKLSEDRGPVLLKEAIDIAYQQKFSLRGQV